MSWLLSRKPRTMVRAPKAYSMLVVMEKASPSSSTTEILAGAAALLGGVGAERALLGVGRRSGRDLALRAVRIDQRAPLGEIRRVEQARDRDGHEIGIGQIAGAVGESEPLGLGDDVGGIKLERRGAEVERRQQAERLADRDRARRGRARAAHAMIAIRRRRPDRVPWRGNWRDPRR